MCTKFLKYRVSIKVTIKTTSDFDMNNFYVVTKSKRNCEVPFKTTNELTADLFSYHFTVSLKIQY